MSSYPAVKSKIDARIDCLRGLSSKRDRIREESSAPVNELNFLLQKYEAKINYIKKSYFGNASAISLKLYSKRSANEQNFSHDTTTLETAASPASSSNIDLQFLNNHEF